jgi:hypothetical protein
MVTVSKRVLVVAVCACLVVGWAANAQLRPDPKKDRPVLKAVAKIAKTALWIMVFAEPAPPQCSEEIQSVLVDEQGYAHLNHARGW